MYPTLFIRGSLPRKDCGSREQYCIMLTLFKPWRSGKDLKESPSQLWVEVFTHHKFSEHAKEVMRFFHNCYECNNARDDFCA